LTEFCSHKVKTLSCPDWQHVAFTLNVRNQITLAGRVLRNL